MEQQNLLKYTKRLEHQINLLLESHANLKNEVEHFKQENQELKAELASQRVQLENFQNQSKISKIVRYLGVDEGNPSELKEKIDEYIVEIDNCISYLNKEL